LLSHRLRVAAPIEVFVGFAVGRSVWADAIAAHRRGELDDACAVIVSARNLRSADLCCSSDPELVGREHMITVLTAIGTNRRGAGTAQTVSRGRAPADRAEQEGVGAGPAVRPPGTIG
jgi:hypothetical protein